VGEERRAVEVVEGRRAVNSELSRAYRGKRVLVTGHTGFKGSWLVLWLESLGAEVHGLALAPETPQWLFSAAQLERHCRHALGDVRDFEAVAKRVDEVKPEVVFHLAAQPLVRRSYQQPLETLATNVMGTAHVLEAVRKRDEPCRVVIVTSDKCYENRERDEGYREDEAMGGHDPYSMSKGATELVTASWRRSFFPVEQLAKHGVAVASARAGNVIGGGDWAEDRLVPDIVRSLAQQQPVPGRNPRSVRPWQHVLEPLSGYLLLGARLEGADAASAAEAWNFGPKDESSRTVRELVEAMIAAWGSGKWEDKSDPKAVHEAKLLRLSIEKAKQRLGWSPRWGFDETVRRTTEWYRAQTRGAKADELVKMTQADINAYGSV
jgi:CDP-glucose 4,6-dehydratase